MKKWFLKKYYWWIYRMMMKAIKGQHIDEVFLYVLKIKLRNVGDNLSDKLKDSAEGFILSLEDEERKLTKGEN